VNKDYQILVSIMCKEEEGGSKQRLT